ncbi:NADP-dependent oxidoreductase domain-containing protein [Hyaloscypha finlandica]|nr:NADP-dependent oxidoreductase domain-containing protein [Hyaloscypha finlandica]
MAETVFSLNTGRKIPALGFGTWQSKPGEVEKAVEYALSVGYRHIDAAYSYGNEEEVGIGLKKAFEAGVKREDVFVTTKLWSTHHRRVQENLAMSLDKLGLDYVDLYLMHWPVAMNTNGNHPLFPTTPGGSRDVDFSRNHVDTYLDMEKLVHTGKVKAIGVANYSVVYLEELLTRASIVPAANQIENHPLLPQDDVSDFCKAKGIHITAYSPLGSTGSPLLTLPVVVQIATKHGVSPANILLSYHIERGHSVLAKSVTPARIKANHQITKLDRDDMDALARVSSGGNLKRHGNPPWKVNLGFPDQQFV